MNPVNAIRFLSMFIVLLAISSCREQSITEYEPKNPDEEKIISLLASYQDAKNSFDIGRLLSCLHDEGTFTFACGVMVSKTRLKKVLPDFWSDIRSKDRMAAPLSHECLNGDYFDSGQLNLLKIKISGKTAEADAMVTKGFSRVVLQFRLLRENSQWLITRTEWGRS